MSAEERLDRTKAMRMASQQCPTKLEMFIYSFLEYLNIEYNPQFAIGKYVVDVFIPSMHLIIEADGCYWHHCKECKFKIASENENNCDFERDGFFEK